MSKDQSQTVVEVMKQMEGVELRVRHGARFRFRLHLTEAMSGTAIEALDLSVRSYNSLKRAGYHCIGDVAEAIAAGTELKGIRNCGAKSVREIMEHLFLFQYNSLPVEKQEAYLREVVKINCR